VIWATTSVTALDKAIKLWDIKRLELVTPFIDKVQGAIVNCHGGIGDEIGLDMKKHVGWGVTA